MRQRNNQKNKYELKNDFILTCALAHEQLQFEKWSPSFLPPMKRFSVDRFLPEMRNLSKGNKGYQTITKLTSMGQHPYRVP